MIQTNRRELQTDGQMLQTDGGVLPDRLQKALGIGLFMRKAYEMKYLHPVEEKSNLELMPYKAEYKAAYKKLYNECYHEMREALDIKPYDFIQDDSFFEEGMENVYLLTEASRLVGSVAIKGDEVDDLLVDKRYQRKGYGRRLLLWALEHMEGRDIVLHVAGWNEGAMELYRKTGFEVTQEFII